MSCQFIDGNKIATELRLELKEKISKLKSYGITPRLVAIMAGNDPASQIYVNKKIAACEEVGINASKMEVQTVNDLHLALGKLNDNDLVHGYILQLPLPGWNPVKFFSFFDPTKDVDVFHPLNVGLLVQGRPKFKPCTPHGIQIMLNKTAIKVSGKKICVINRSNVVGKPLSSMLIQECDDYANATVTVCHDKTPPELLKEVTLSSDIVIVAVGKPGFLTGDMVKQGATVIDVGITRVNNKIVGDVDPSVYEIAAWCSKVPGGVGPLTIACLLENTYKACLFKHPFEASILEPDLAKLYGF